MDERTGRQPLGIVIEDVSMRFVTPHGEMPVLQDINLTIEPGQFVSFVGPSGCGKTTLLNMIASLLRPDRGRVLVGGKPVDGNNAAKGIGYMLARDALLPWRNAVRNVEYSLDILGVGRQEKRERALRQLDKVGLKGFENYYRDQLSQGMRQRVALARTLAADPTVVLMDEPFAALDAQTRRHLETEFLALLDREPKTVVFVTHDVVEAVSMSDVVVVFSSRPGRIKRVYRLAGRQERQRFDGPMDPNLTEMYQKVWEDLDNG
jgi:ABC-type nitrate/sulfonate/bicarbonate transport system ATPase subunit